MSVTHARGFAAWGLACGIKDSGAPDFSLVVSQRGPVAAAATFTTNLAAAAPVVVSRAHLAASRGRIAGVVLNSGCANAATGAPGLADAERTADAVAVAIGSDTQAVLVCSTGLIGPRLRVDALLSGIEPLVAGLAATPEGGLAAARGIMTTDTKPKQATADGVGFVAGGMAKGAGMIAPNMATMLSVVTTDADVTLEVLTRALRRAVSASFNELIVDGATSTNDTVICLASGLGAPVGEDALADVLTQVAVDLAEQMAADAEGTTRVARIRVRGARSDEEARLAARKVAGSLLVKASLFGADPYWGRIVSELGSSGADFELDRVSVAYGDTVACVGGVDAPHDRDAVAAYLSQPVVEITCDLGLADGTALVRTTDIGHGYIDENMRTS